MNGICSAQALCFPTWVQLVLLKCGNDDSCCHGAFRGLALGCICRPAPPPHRCPSLDGFSSLTSLWPVSCSCSGFHSQAFSWNKHSSHSTKPGPCYGPPSNTCLLLDVCVGGGGMYCKVGMGVPCSGCHKSSQETLRYLDPSAPKAMHRAAGKHRSAEL